MGVEELVSDLLPGADIVEQHPVKLRGVVTRIAPSSAAPATAVHMTVNESDHGPDNSSWEKATRALVMCTGDHERYAGELEKGDRLQVEGEQVQVTTGPGKFRGFVIPASIRLVNEGDE